MGADPDSESWDNRKLTKENVQLAPDSCTKQLAAGRAALDGLNKAVAASGVKAVQFNNPPSHPTWLRNRTANVTLAMPPAIPKVMPPASLGAMPTAYWWHGWTG